jgi:hypothetical protein
MERPMGLPVGAAAPSSGVTCSGRLPNPGSSAGPSGGEHGQRARQRQANNQPTERREEPAGLSAGFGRRRAWRQAAAEIEQYRRTYQIRDPERARPPALMALDRGYGSWMPGA